MMPPRMELFPFYAAGLVILVMLAAFFGQEIADAVERLTRRRGK